MYEEYREILPALTKFCNTVIYLYIEERE